MKRAFVPHFLNDVYCEIKCDREDLRDMDLSVSIRRQKMS